MKLKCTFFAIGLVLLASMFLIGTDTRDSLEGPALRSEETSLEAEAPSLNTAKRYKDTNGRDSVGKSSEGELLDLAAGRQHLDYFRSLDSGLREFLTLRDQGDRDSFLETYGTPHKPSREIAKADAEQTLTEYDLGMLEELGKSYAPLLKALALDALEEIDRTFSDQLNQGGYAVWRKGSPRPQEKEIVGAFGFSNIAGIGPDLFMCSTYDSGDHPRVESIMSRIRDVQFEIVRVQRDYLEGL